MSLTLGRPNLNRLRCDFHKKMFHPPSLFNPTRGHVSCKTKFGLDQSSRFDVLGVKRFKRSATI